MGHGRSETIKAGSSITSDRPRGRVRTHILGAGINRESWRTAARSLRRCVFAAGLLCVRAFCSALLVLQASDACPGALQIVAHCDVQRAAALTGEFDVVAVH